MGSTYTTVINMGGVRKYFSFLPPHGIWLDGFQSITYCGDLLTRLIPGWPYCTDPDRKPNKVKVNALKNSEDKGELKVIREHVSIRHEGLTSQYRKVDMLFITDPAYRKER